MESSSLPTSPLPDVFSSAATKSARSWAMFLSWVCGSDGALPAGTAEMIQLTSIPTSCVAVGGAGADSGGKANVTGNFVEVTSNRTGLDMTAWKVYDPPKTGRDASVSCAT